MTTARSLNRPFNGTGLSYRRLWSGAHSSCSVAVAATLVLTALIVPPTSGQAADPSLHAAAQQGSVEEVGTLLRGGTNVDSRADDDKTPLYLASWKGNADVVRLLLEHGADVNASNANGMTALHTASWAGQEAVMRILLDSGADVEALGDEGRGTPLHQAAMGGHAAAVGLLLDRGANIEATSESFGIRPLHAAVQRKQRDIVQFLLNRGADVNARNESGNTPLHMAAYRDLTDVSRFLIARGADLTITDDDGNTALHDAAAAGHIAVSRLLIDEGADFLLNNGDGQTPGEIAASNGHSMAARYFSAMEGGRENDPSIVASYFLDRSRVAEGLVKIPVFEWSGISASLASGMANEDTRHYFDQQVLTPVPHAWELHNFRKGSGTSALSFQRNGTVTTLSHDPASGYSEWTLPDFAPSPDGVAEYWRSIEYEFALEPGTSLADFSLPLQFRTSLSPTNKIEINLRKNGEIRFEAVNVSDADTVSYRSHNTVRGDGRISLQYVFSNLGHWSIYANGEFLDAGTIPPAYITRGLSNKFWFEGTQHITRLAVTELYRPSDVGNIPALTERALAQLDASLAESLGEHVGQYRGLGASSFDQGLEVSGDSWTYTSHERIATRRLNIRSESEDESEDESEEVETRLGYRVALMVTGTRPDGTTLSLPLAYEVMLDDTGRPSGVTNLFFYDDAVPYRVLISEL